MRVRIIKALKDNAVEVSSLIVVSFFIYFFMYAELSIDGQSELQELIFAFYFIAITVITVLFGGVHSAYEWSLLVALLMQNFVLFFIFREIIKKFITIRK